MWAETIVTDMSLTGRRGNTPHGPGAGAGRCCRALHSSLVLLTHRVFLPYHKNWLFQTDVNMFPIKYFLREASIVLLPIIKMYDNCLYACDPRRQSARQCKKENAICSVLWPSPSSQISCFCPWSRESHSVQRRFWRAGGGRCDSELAYTFLLSRSKFAELHQWPPGMSMFSRTLELCKNFPFRTKLVLLEPSVP